jgi:hypothetical protein
MTIHDNNAMIAIPAIPPTIGPAIQARFVCFDGLSCEGVSEEKLVSLEVDVVTVSRVVESPW